MMICMASNLLSQIPKCRPRSSCIFLYFDMPMAFFFADEAIDAWYYAVLLHIGSFKNNIIVTRTMALARNRPDGKAPIITAFIAFM